jgi:hypothetical protein
VGLPTVRRVVYGPLPAWARKRRQRVTAPRFDQNGTMLWQRDGHGQWVQKVNDESGPQHRSEPANCSGYQ